MLPTLNGKSFLDCTEEDLQELLDNPDYRENEYIDYKASFAFLEMDKRNPERQAKIVEFRNDVCAFANAEGGYLIYGISDVKGMAKEIVGIEIPNSNTDKFELERKNNLDSIMPKMPSLQFGYISLTNQKYVVVIQIRKDGFAPYVHLENEMNYKAYKRVGNGKSPIGYVELKNMFNQSLSIENEVHKYRQMRIDFYRNQDDTDNQRYSKFLLLHILPDTFTDPFSRKNLFLIQKQTPSLRFADIFDGLRCQYLAQPNVDGLRFPVYENGPEALLTNYGIAECLIPLKDSIQINDMFPQGYFPTDYLWGRIEIVIKRYIRIMKPYLETSRLFLCISVVGCKGVVSEHNYEECSVGGIDRNILSCTPIAIEDANNENEVDLSLKWLKIEFCLSLGIKASKILNDLIAEVSKHDNE